MRVFRSNESLQIKVNNRNEKKLIILNTFEDLKTKKIGAEVFGEL